jgi:hypothetical protein
VRRRVQYIHDDEQWLFILLVLLSSDTLFCSDAFLLSAILLFILTLMSQTTISVNMTAVWEVRSLLWNVLTQCFWCLCCNAKQCIRLMRLQVEMQYNHTICVYLWWNVYYSMLFYCQVFCSDIPVLPLFSWPNVGNVMLFLCVVV